MVFRALSALVLGVAVAPFAFAIACSPKKADPSAPTASVEPQASSAAVAVESSSPPPPASSSAPPRPVITGTAELVFIEGPCKELNAARQFIRDHRNCSADAECEVVTPGCACAMGVQKSYAPEAKKRHDAAYDACIARNLPVSCATCGPTPVPRCAGGTCRP